MRRLLHIIIFIGLFLAVLPASALADGGTFTVVLDAGHGGKDPGTIGSASSNREKDIAYNITMEIGRLLKKNHAEIKVVYTRSTDVFIELGRRAEIANKAKADLFVSIHVNALPKDAGHYAYGVQSYTLSLKSVGTNLAVEKRENSVIALEGEAAKKYNYNASAESDIMYELMQDHDMKESVVFAKMAQNEMVHTGGRKDMGVRQANLAVLRLTYMPSVLLEVGFISTPAEEKFLMTKDGQNLMAKSIYNAIAKYASQHTGKQARLEQPSATPDSSASTEATEVKQESVPASAATAQALAPKTVYKVQVLAGSAKLKSNDKQFKGLKCEMHQKDGRYTYTYGSATTMEEAKKLRQSILNKFPQAFIVTFTE
ncbi:MAG: N-acetylmuramoyl-L-alanine amidase [Bacteroidaceae bacterium]|nr:N-acetylmuramoyl-L-alanine amidase [Bacteroidaceae bacterium]